MVPRYYLGIDIGTYESKGMIVDQNGRCLLNHAVAHDMESPQTGYAEHDAEKVWWGDFCRISRALIRKSGLDSRMIKGIGCSAIGPCCLPVDEDGIPLSGIIFNGYKERRYLMGENYSYGYYKPSRYGRAFQYSYDAYGSYGYSGT